MSEEEIKAIEILRFSPIFRGRKPENDCLEIVLNLIGKQQKELEEKTTILMVGADKVKQLEKENKELKEDKKELFEEYQKRLKEKFDLEQKISNIIENSYNDIDYFNRDMRKDFEDLLEE